MDYDNMLSRLYMTLPAQTKKGERFELPKLESNIQGKKTIVRNFSQAIKAVKREEKHFYKYLTKETATAAAIEEGKLVMNGKFTYDGINKLFESYLKEFVLCHECGKPDTEIIDRNGVKVLKCTACGALNPLKRIR